MGLRRTVVVGGCVAGLSLAGTVEAAGMYVGDRGVRPMGRAGAFVAGADDPGAVWYNPAGLTEAKTALLLDGTWLNYGVTYARRSRSPTLFGPSRDDSYPAVEGTTPFLPMPTVAGSLALGPTQSWVVAASLSAPMLPILTYPARVQGEPAPSRFSLVSSDGSLLVSPGIHGAYKIHESFRVGVGLTALVGTIEQTVVGNGSPANRLRVSPNDGTLDSFTRLQAGGIFAPSLQLGLLWIPSDFVRFGASFQSKSEVRGTGPLTAEVPLVSTLSPSTVLTREVELQFTLPTIVRLGAEVRPAPSTRVEFSYVLEFWGSHETIEVVPRGPAPRVLGVTSPVDIAPNTIPRFFENTQSFRAGGEHRLALTQGEDAKTIDLRAGLAFEQGAIPPAYVSPMTVDANKWTLGLGAGLHWGKNLRFDVSMAKLFYGAVDVSPSEARVPRINVLQGGNENAEYINGGSYQASALLLGLGAQLTL